MTNFIQEIPILFSKFRNPKKTDLEVGTETEEKTAEETAEETTDAIDAEADHVTDTADMTDHVTTDEVVVVGVHLDEDLDPHLDQTGKIKQTTVQSLK